MPDELTSRISSTSAFVTGCLYAIIAAVSREARDSDSVFSPKNFSKNIVTSESATS